MDEFQTGGQPVGVTWDTSVLGNTNLPLKYLRGHQPSWQVLGHTPFETFRQGR